MMKMKNIIIAAMALMAVSCVYPFEAETVDGSGSLVIEGDILVGEVSKVVLGLTYPVGGVPATVAHGTVWIEDDAGREYQADKWYDYNQKIMYEIDTRDADPSRQFRLHVDNVGVKGGHDYESSWQSVTMAPEIDSLSYLKDPERSRFNITLSMHSKQGSFFKWNYIEDWEYHVDYHATYIYHPPQTGWWGVNGYGSIEELVPPDNIYYCYGHEESSEILTFSTEKQTDDRFVDLEFRKIPRDDIKISFYYRIKVFLEALDKDAYTYWENMKTNSEYNGNLFAPTPSEMVGNIRCVQDPEELVIGYISATQRAQKTLFLDAADVQFYKRNEPYVEPVLLESPSDWYLYYSREQFLPYSSVVPHDTGQTYWAPARCVDCRKRGGTLTKPDDWPKMHW
jgi:hypothetical protein